MKLSYIVTGVAAILVVVALALVVMAIFLVLTSDAKADTLVARCESETGCVLETHAVGPGVIAWSWSMGPDSFGVAGWGIKVVEAGEYAKVTVDPVWLAAWQEQWGVACVRFRYKWLRHATASKLWSEPSTWCLGEEASDGE